MKDYSLSGQFGGTKKKKKKTLAREENFKLVFSVREWSTFMLPAWYRN